MIKIKNNQWKSIDVHHHLQHMENDVKVGEVSVNGFYGAAKLECKQIEKVISKNKFVIKLKNFLCLSEFSIFIQKIFPIKKINFFLKKTHFALIVAHVVHRR
jgi:hypothetical protein